VQLSVQLYGYQYNCQYNCEHNGQAIPVPNLTESNSKAKGSILTKARAQLQL
jgi:hypothetical protein